MRSKTDKEDSKRLAQYGELGHGRVWQPEPLHVRQLKALMTRLEALGGDIIREENRLESLEVSKLSKVAIKSSNDVIKFLNKEKSKIEKEFDKHFDDHEDLKKDYELLKSIPGIGPVVAKYLACLLRSKPFEKATQAAEFVGLNPVIRQSGTSLNSAGKLSKAGCSTIRAKLYMAAVVAKRHNPLARDLYDRLLKKGKAKMCALGAVMRKLVHIGFGVLKHQTKFCSQGINA